MSKEKTWNEENYSSVYQKSRNEKKHLRVEANEKHKIRW